MAPTPATSLCSPVGYRPMHRFVFDENILFGSKLIVGKVSGLGGESTDSCLNLSVNLNMILTIFHKVLSLDWNCELT